jgi:L-threonylcarbamoyladenylate synthase
VRRVRIGDLLASPERIASLREILSRGGLAAVPTESFYGLAADPSSAAGVERVLAVKGREAGKPLLVLFGERRQLGPLAVAAAPAVLDRFFAIWPAPLTVVLPLRAPIPASLSARTLGVRMPADAALRDLLAHLGPVTGTSLNRAGEAPCQDAEEVARRFAREIDVLVDGGRTPGGLPSTVVDATVDPPRLIRAGAFAWPPERR